MGEGFLFRKMQGKKKAFSESMSHTLSLTHCETSLYDPFFLFCHNSGIIISKRETVASQATNCEHPQLGIKCMVSGAAEALGSSLPQQSIEAGLMQNQSTTMLGLRLEVT